MKKYTAICILLLMINLIYATGFSWFSQTDSRWGSNRLGRGTSIARSGCVVSCLSMMLNAEASNPYMTPDKLNDWLRKNGGYYGNNMRWQIPGLIDGDGLGLELEGQSTRYNDWDFLNGELEKGNKVIVKVAGRRSHWVLVVKQDGPIDKASSYHVNDPGMSSYEERTLAYWGGFRSARSYSGNWLDEEAFNLESEINVVPVAEEESFLYDIYKLPLPADVFVTLQNNLNVEIQGFFILGLFDSENNLVSTIDYEYAEIGANDELDLLYEMPDYSPLENDEFHLKIVYSKYFSAMPSRYDTVKLNPAGIRNLTKSYSEED
ncbi:MAG: C39 family peptidase [Candidatus Cloacimonetes bacterium]|nr:C39 family peptidase [Candidatus Cloacimonadota bacterium]MCB5279270.1 C39 family peptidase [Candidatus Cloacimonadota bacterium]MCK9332128.1 C39 family peptidase [Candidatus Cloacimonadota bacterium]MDD4232085.1 C39 family peptidase [Candidatus Cloacimonadota bacterium]MDY0298794.1 C39 family peptidase [Candidatus Cloacimonadaceae bacterium]